VRDGIDRLQQPSAAVLSVRKKLMGLRLLDYFVQECCWTLPSTRECGIWVYQRDLEDVYREFFGRDPDPDWLRELAAQYGVQIADPLVPSLGEGPQSKKPGD
jgi:hypothetical protein